MIGKLRSLVIICLSLLLFSACDVHEWPDNPESVKYNLRINCHGAQMTEWEHVYDSTTVIDMGYGEIYNNNNESGKIRYIIRTYPVTKRKLEMQDYVQEFVFVNDIDEDYDFDVMLDLLPGNYNLMVWSDIVEYNGDEPFYDATDFSNIYLKGEHAGSNDYRDAFRGVSEIFVVDDVMEQLHNSVDIIMQRPLAKFEFISNDLEEFMEREAMRIANQGKSSEEDSEDDVSIETVNIEEYKVVFYYVGFMPNAFSMYTDKPVDASTGVMFESTLKKLSNSEASLGFDYVFVNGQESKTTVQVVIYDNEGTQVSLTEPIDVPLKRSHHTILTGKFLMTNSSGGININPDFDGDHNLFIP